jgi:hypothetical protein
VAKIPHVSRYRTRFDVYQPSGWNSPGVKKAIDVYCGVMIASIKVLLTIALTIMAFGASWLFWTLIALLVADIRA